jgi:hypothetical protein
LWPGSILPVARTPPGNSPPASMASDATATLSSGDKTMKEGAVTLGISLDGFYPNEPVIHFVFYPQ